MARVKVKLDKRLVARIQKRFQKEIPDLLEKEIVDRSIKKGISPVKGQRRFQKYSNSYRRSIKDGRIKGKNKISPVNMIVTGTMLKSFFVRPFRNGVKIGFLDPLAVIHNDLGASVRKVIRRLLPTKPNEEFNRSIFINLRRTLRKIIRQETR